MTDAARQGGPRQEGLLRRHEGRSSGRNQEECTVTNLRREGWLRNLDERSRKPEVSPDLFAVIFPVRLNAKPAEVIEALRKPRMLRQAQHERLVVTASCRLT
jgi:hypothetical protein